MTDECRGYDVDGQPVMVHGDRPLEPADLDALAVVVRAARAHLKQLMLDDPQLAERQEAARARNHARLVRLGMAND